MRHGRAVARCGADARQGFLQRMAVEHLGLQRQFSARGQMTLVHDDQLLGEHEITVCGMSLGYPQQDAPVHLFAMPRRTVEEFVRFNGFE